MPEKDEIELIRELQEEFPLCERPFAVIAERLGRTEEEVLVMTERLREKRYLKRIAAALYHTQAGYRVNSLELWDVPADRLEEAARAASELPQVSHCYERLRTNELDYNLYTMVHEITGERYQDVIRQMEALIRPEKHVSLRTVKELKKAGMKYYTCERN